MLLCFERLNINDDGYNLTILLAFYLWCNIHYTASIFFNPVQLSQILSAAKERGDKLAYGIAVYGFCHYVFYARFIVYCFSCTFCFVLLRIMCLYHVPGRDQRRRRARSRFP